MHSPRMCMCEPHVNNNVFISFKNNYLLKNLETDKGLFPSFLFFEECLVTTC